MSEEQTVDVTTLDPPRPPGLEGVESKVVTIDGARTHYLEAGQGPDLVLLHSCEFGGAAEVSWQHNLTALAQHFHVLAPDYVGFGRTDKLRDFGGHGRRMRRQIGLFLEYKGVTSAGFIGNSVSGRFLCREASDPASTWPIAWMVIASGGGYEPLNEAREALEAFDTTRVSLRAMLSVIFHDPRWVDDDDYLDLRLSFANMPGAWEVAAAHKFRSPIAPVYTNFGVPDKTAYEQIDVPTLFVAGENDQLLEPEYWHELARRTPQGHAVSYPLCGHAPHVEQAERFNADVLDFARATGAL